MLYVAARACTDSMTQQEIDEGRTFPDITRIRDVSRVVAVAIIEEGIKQKLTTKIGQAEIDEGEIVYIYVLM